jgi:hypothetical protein
MDGTTGDAVVLGDAGPCMGDDDDDRRGIGGRRDITNRP